MLCSQIKLLKGKQTSLKQNLVSYQGKYAKVLEENKKLLARIAGTAEETAAFSTFELSKLRSYENSTKGDRQFISKLLEYLYKWNENDICMRSLKGTTKEVVLDDGSIDVIEEKKPISPAKLRTIEQMFASRMEELEQPPTGERFKGLNRLISLGIQSGCKRLNF